MRDFDARLPVTAADRNGRGATVRRALLGWSPVSLASGLDVAWAEIDLSFEITPADGADTEAIVLKSSYLAIPVEQVAGLMRSVGFQNVRRLDGRFFQPVLVGTRSP